MPPYKHLERYRQIVGILADEGFDDMLDITGLRRFQPVHRRLRPEHDTRQPIGLRLRHTLERLGPTFVKLGQVASTRPDLIPDDIIEELRCLQDDVAAFPDAEAFALIEAELGGTIDDVFLEFERTPMAAASLGQVYRATLPDGTDVVVKVQRPNVEETVSVDLDILLTQARFVAQHSEFGARYDVVGITREFAEAVRGELDYHAEGANAERLGQMFADDETVAFPTVFWEFSTKRVLTLERLDGLPFNRPEALSEAGMDRAQLAQRGIYCYLEQIFVHGFYHADPHPGNLLALEDGRVAFTDFGRCGTISKVGRDQLADLFMAIVDDDVPLAVDTLFTAAGSPGEIDVAELEREVSRLITKYYNKSLDQIRMGDLINEVMALVRNHHLMLSSELAMLMTTLVVLEGLGRLLDPNFDFVAVTEPFARKLTAARLEPAALSRTFVQTLRRFVNIGQDLPETLTRFLRRAGQGEFRIAVHPTGFDPIMKRFEETANRLAFALVVSAFVIGLSFILARTELPVAFIWVARIAWAAAVGVGSWFFISAINARYRNK
ncbi:MAG: AarF/ABC1/UbiB kinase family protein [Coriobacteriia bacterium]|nr:AarF/ABC1/UbiB kinase family protein [Coriobacteriia bacterium]